MMLEELLIYTSVSLVHAPSLTQSFGSRQHSQWYPITSLTVLTMHCIILMRAILILSKQTDEATSYKQR
jgi:hypothetical protein